jgi:3-oxoacyl-[acyl-carrier protein] reductase
MEPSEIQELFQFVGTKWGKLDCLVNNAGVWQHNALNQFDEEKFIASIRINVRGPFLCTEHALHYLRMSKSASIVNIGSTAGQRGEAYYSPYAASKGAIGAATKSWAVELAPDIRVNCVAPGWVDTEMSAESLRRDADLRGEIEAQIPTGRVASAEDIAGAVVFLASVNAGWPTGRGLDRASGELEGRALRRPSKCDHGPARSSRRRAPSFGVRGGRADPRELDPSLSRSPAGRPDWPRGLTPLPASGV